MTKISCQYFTRVIHLGNSKQAMEDSIRKATSNKRLHNNQRVLGAVEGPTKHRHQQRLYGNVVRAVGECRYLVQFDNGLKKECASAMLRVERPHTSLTPDLPLPTSQIEHRWQDDEAQEVLMDQEEEEHVSNESPDDEEEGSMGSPDEEDGGDNPPNETTGGDDPPNGMPGQFQKHH